METEKKTKRNPLTILIVVLALIVLAEGIFLLANRKNAAPADPVAASGAPADNQNGSPADGQPSDDASGAPDNGAGSAGGDKNDADPNASAAPDNGADSGSAAPAQTPPIEIPPENRDKAYAGAVGALSNYTKSPSTATLAYVLGGELVGEQMQKFLPALFTMSGGNEETIRDELAADLDITTGTTSLTVAGEKALSAEQLQSASDKLKDMEASFSSMGALADEVKSFTDSDWNEFGSQLNLSGPQAKQLFMDLTSSSSAIAGMLSGAKITEGYQLTLKSNTGDTTVTNVYCINGKWVTSAFFDMQFS